ncbi:MAG: tetratricopeptide repeat protein [Candidatus Krumholzibacteriota bacterium]|nr:tetratricopeptide repeat protein [Candidatus Krumholzibacteriota bacterium]
MGTITRYTAIALAIASLLLAGCAGLPPAESPPPPPAPEPAPSAPSAVSVILDARLLAGNGDYAEAAGMLDELLARDGGNVEARRLLAAVYAADGRRADAAAEWKRVLDLDPADPEAAYEVGVQLARAGDWTALRSRMLETERLGAAEPRHYLLLGEAEVELRSRREAERHLLMAGDHVRARYLLGRLYYDQGRAADAKKAFLDVVGRDPSNASAHLHLGWLFYREGSRRSAMRHYRKAVELAPGDALARLSLAALLEETDRPRDAIEHYRAAVQLDNIPREEKKKAYNSLSRLLVAHATTAEAIALVNTGLREFPDAGGLWYEWGEALVREGRTGEAREKFRRAAADPAWKEHAIRRLNRLR